MKIQCDVCEIHEALVFCIADEAALCSACDHRVHHANKLAGKHQRFSFHHPSPKEAPLCDICQERRAFLFCLQDRATLCRECDTAIHKANELTQKHTRFLFTGIKLSSTSALYSPSSSPAESDSVPDGVPNSKSRDSKSNPVLVPPTNNNTTSTSKSGAVESNLPAAPGSCDKSKAQFVSFKSPISTSSISEDLIEMLPGWQVEDFLDSSFPSYGICKDGDNDVLPFLYSDPDTNMSTSHTENMGFWVPQVPPPLYPAQNQPYQSIDLSFGASNGMKEYSKDYAINNIKSSRKRSQDSSFVVPQMTPSLSASKRLRTLW